MNLNIPKWPYSNDKENKAIENVLKSGNWWRNAGQEVKLFETEFSTFQNVNYGISVANGTVAIETILNVLKIGEGDEVILPAFTFYSTVSAILAVKAVPVMVDVLEDTFCIDPIEVEKAITDKTKAVIAVHIAGEMADMDELLRITEKYRIHLIEDAAHAHGASWKGKKAGTLSSFASFSFQNAKLLTSGEGGMILSNNEQFAKDCFLYTNCGRKENDTDYQHVMVATNARLSEFQGAILRCQLERFEEQLQTREANYRYFESLIEKVEGIKLQAINKNVTCHSHYMVMFYYDKNYFKGKTRKEFIDYLRQKGIPCNRSYDVLYHFPMFKMINKSLWRVGSDKDQKKGYCKNAEHISDDVVCLNHNIFLADKKTIEDLVYIIEDFKNN